MTRDPLEYTCAFQRCGGFGQGSFIQASRMASNCSDAMNIRQDARFYSIQRRVPGLQLLRKQHARAHSHPFAHKDPIHRSLTHAEACGMSSESGIAQCESHNHARQRTQIRGAVIRPAPQTLTAHSTGQLLGAARRLQAPHGPGSLCGGKLLMHPDS